MSAAAMGWRGMGVRYQRCRKSRPWELSMGNSMVSTAVFIVLIVLLVGCGGIMGATAAAPQSSSSSTSGDGGPLIEVTGVDHFEKLIQTNNTEGSVVAFTVSWCGHCKALKPELEAAAVELAKIGIPVLLADGDRLKKVARRYGVTGFPALFIFPPITSTSTSPSSCASPTGTTTTCRASS